MSATEMGAAVATWCRECDMAFYVIDEPAFCPYCGASRRGRVSRGGPTGVSCRALLLVAVVLFGGEFGFERDPHCFNRVRPFLPVPRRRLRPVRFQRAFHSPATPLQRLFERWRSGRLPKRRLGTHAA